LTAGSIVSCSEYLGLLWTPSHPRSLPSANREGGASGDGMSDI